MSRCLGLPGGVGGAERIIFAGTDLSLLFDTTNTTFPAIDCAQPHIDAIPRAQGLTA